MRTLFNITADLLQLYDAIDEVGAVDETGRDPKAAEDERLLAAWLAALEAEEGQKVDAYAALIFQLDMEGEKARTMATSYTAKARTREERVRWLKTRLIEHMLATGRKKLVGASGQSLSVQAAGGKAPVVFSDAVEKGDFSGVPAEFIVAKPVIDKDKVRAALEAGEVLEFASLAERGVILRIRT